jgi:hypothetical protein
MLGTCPTLLGVIVIDAVVAGMMAIVRLPLGSMHMHTPTHSQRQCVARIRSAAKRARQLAHSHKTCAQQRKEQQRDAVSHAHLDSRKHDFKTRKNQHRKVQAHFSLTSDANPACVAQGLPNFMWGHLQLIRMGCAWKRNDLGFESCAARALERWGRF